MFEKDITFELGGGEVVLTVSYQILPEAHTSPPEGTGVIEVLNIHHGPEPVPLWLYRVLTEGDWLADRIASTHD